MKKLVFALFAAFLFVFSATTFQNGSVTQNTVQAAPAVSWRWVSFYVKPNEVSIGIRYTNNTTDRVITRIYDRKFTRIMPKDRSLNKTFGLKKVIKLELMPGESYTRKISMTNKEFCKVMNRYFNGTKRKMAYKIGEVLQLKHSFKYKSKEI